MAITDLASEAGTGVPPGMSSAEWTARTELAACYRIFNHLGWVELIFNHITVRVPGPDHHLLINPFGLFYEEVTASNLVKIDLEGNIVGSSDWSVNKAGSIIHTAIHGRRPDVNCVMHTHTTSGCAVACLRDGLDPNNFYSSQLDDQVSYHNYEGFSVYPDEQERLVQDLGDRSIMILRNHGLLSCGPTIPLAFFRLWTLQRACDIQLAAAVAGPIQEIDAEARRRNREGLTAIGEGIDSGTRVFDALRRQIDRIDPSYRL